MGQAATIDGMLFLLFWGGIVHPFRRAWRRVVVPRDRRTAGDLTLPPVRFRLMCVGWVGVRAVRFFGSQTCVAMTVELTTRMRFSSGVSLLACVCGCTAFSIHLTCTVMVAGTWCGVGFPSDHQLHDGQPSQAPALAPRVAWPRLIHADAAEPDAFHNRLAAAIAAAAAYATSVAAAVGGVGRPSCASSRGGGQGGAAGGERRAALSPCRG